MSSHVVTCRTCHGKFDTNDEAIKWIMPSRGWYYHVDCYSNFVKQRDAIKNGDITQTADDDFWLGATYDYLTKDLKMSIVYVKMLSQWNNFVKKNMTPKGIYFTLRYFYDIQKGNKDKSENGIGIVPYIYSEGTQYWGERNQRDKGICARIEAQILASRSRNVKIIYQKEKKTKIDKDNKLAAIAEMEDEE